MRWIALSLAVCLAVFVGVLGWTILTGLQDEQPFPTQPTLQAQPKPPAQPKPQTQPKPGTRTLVDVATLPPRLGLRYVHTHLGPIPHLVEAKAVSHTFRYVLQEDAPAFFLDRGMSGFLYDFRFGVKGRKTVVRLLDGDGRLAWATGYDGIDNVWVRARPKLRECGPIWYAKGHTLPSAPGAADAPPCPVTPPTKTKQVNMTSTVLR